MSVRSDAGDTAEVLAERACAALAKDYDVGQVDQKDLKELRAAIAKWIVANRSAINIGDTRQVELEFHLQLPAPRRPTVPPVAPPASGAPARSRLAGKNR